MESSPADMNLSYGDLEHFIQHEIDRSPEPLRKLGEYLASVLDEDEWKTAERMLLGACVNASKTKVPSVEELEQTIYERTRYFVPQPALREFHAILSQALCSSCEAAGTLAKSNIVESEKE